MNAARNRKKGYTLVEALEARRGLGATDPRDFVYANLGVASYGCLEVNYEKTSQWIYAQAAIYLVEELGIANLILYIDNVAARERLEGLPSWAPDWRLPSSDSTPLRRGKYTQVDYRVNHVFVEGNGSFVMGHIGYTVDTVKITSGTVPPADETHCVNPDYEGAWDAFTTGRSSLGLDFTVQSVLGTMWASWVAWFQGLEGRTAPRSPVDGGFAVFLEQWLSTVMGIAKARKLRDHTEEDIMGWFHGHFKRPGAQSLLTGRRLAITETGKFCVVPSRTRPGDIMGYLATSSMEVIFRSIQIRRRSRVSDAVVQAFQESGRGKLYLPEGIIREWDGEYTQYFDWSIPDDGTVRVEHYRVVGEGLLQRQSLSPARYDYSSVTEDGPWGMDAMGRLKPSDLQVFALH
ncbi:ankyrin and het domain-containing protein [Colletotrichum plurivorum]|uniref:Ankyrin and het domain-containing protein n=1 Tax=Colletotrichum plurivorum TaxID=2175906 RepID=A0A8H6KDZ6_9PEZI|nr:ankyrin and het domain-containing protein [Colletotrichum plurivorum]